MSDNRGLTNPRAAEKAKEARNERITWVAPPVDIYENEREFLVVADVPGVKADDVQLHFDKGELRFEASGQILPPEGKGKVELGEAHYRRAFQLPDFIDASGLSAELRQGTLYVHLPKQEAVRPRQIVVRAG